MARKRAQQLWCALCSRAMPRSCQHAFRVDLTCASAGARRRRSATLGELHLDHEHNLRSVMSELRCVGAGTRGAPAQRPGARGLCRSWLCYALQGTGSAGICWVRLHAPRGSTNSAGLQESTDSGTLATRSAVLALPCRSRLQAEVTVTFLAVRTVQVGRSDDSSVATQSVL